MQPRIYWILASAAVIFVGCNAVAANEKEKAAGGANYNSFHDDLYLDDQDALEGSGRGGGEVRDDLEASGSGFGPDDEDGDGGRSSNNNVNVNRVNPESKPVDTDSHHIEDPHRNKIITEQNLAPKKPDNEVDVTGPAGGGVGVGGGGGGGGAGEYDADDDENPEDTHEVLIMNPKHEDRASSFFAQPGVLAAIIGGAVVGLLCAILVVMFIVYRMRKKDEGSYALDEPRRSPAAAAYPKPGAPHHNREFYA